MQRKQEKSLLWDGQRELAQNLELDLLLSRSVSVDLDRHFGLNWMHDIKQILLGGVCEAGESLV